MSRDRKHGWHLRPLVTVTTVEERLLALQQAAQEAKTHKEVLRILAEISVIEAMAEPTQLNRVAHELLSVAVNPDKLRDLLRRFEKRRPGALDFIERTVHEQRTVGVEPADADGGSWEA